MPLTNELVVGLPDAEPPPPADPVAGSRLSIPLVNEPIVGLSSPPPADGWIVG